MSKRVCIDEFPEDDDVDDNIFIQPMLTHTGWLLSSYPYIRNYFATII